ncbi:hypothetical protein GOP47_0016160 [Adiantum capillus-veneris]|uniref:Lipoxygenase domain-containing protein n=1 Tax=Adiantum capillus-veneris TaxID=13818 RepID=A0A9D4UL14_ADICA|nr:hypothetical protein GOP47_0016160 [Adiantum capillus-veneris]
MFTQVSGRKSSDFFFHPLCEQMGGGSVHYLTAPPGKTTFGASPPPPQCEPSLNSAHGDDEGYCENSLRGLLRLLSRCLLRNAGQHLQSNLEEEEGLAFIEVKADERERGGVMHTHAHAHACTRAPTNIFYISISRYTALYLPCYTWICPTHLARSGQPRILFPNQMYLPNEAPMALLQLCEDDLLAVGGDGKGKRVHGERIYDYDVYNELRNPEENQDLTRPILGGSGMYPYPRRCKTGRKCIKTDIELEEPELAFDKVYVPRDERFSDLKINLFMNAGVRSFCTYFLVCAKQKSF